MKMFCMKAFWGVLTVILLTTIGSGVSQAAENYREDAHVSEFTPQIVEDVYRYLDEIYLDKYPDFALTEVFGTRIDNTQLQNLADAISQGCETDRDKAYAVYEWINRNVVYTQEKYDYPIDMLMTRQGACTGYAFLMHDLLRKMDVKAVYSSGWQNNMYLATMGEQFKKQVNGMYYYAGHAWCFVYLDGQWELFDPINMVKGTADKEFIADHYYITNVERVTPAYRYPELPHVFVDTIYDGEKFLGVNVENGEIVEDSTITLQMVNFHLLFQSKVKQSAYAHEDLYALDGGDVALGLQDGEVYHGGNWFFGKDSLSGSPGALKTYRYYYSYIRENGIILTSAIKELGDRTFFMGGTTGTDISPIADLDLTTIGGTLAIPVGYHGKLINSEYEKVFGKDTHMFIWESSDESVASVDENGIVTIHKEGSFELELTVKRKNDNAALGGEFTNFFVCENRVPNYSDNVNHAHTYVELKREATCEKGGVVMYTCDDPNCADSYVESETEPTGHSFANYESDNNGTARQEGTKSSHCENAGCEAVNTVIDEDSKASQSLKDTVKDRGICKINNDEFAAYLETLETGWVAEIKEQTYDGVEMSLENLQTMIENQIALNIQLADISLFMEWDVLERVLNQSSGDSVVFAVKEAGYQNLNEKQKEVVSKLDCVMLISAEIYSGENIIHELGGNMNMIFPFYMSEDSGEYKVYYLSEDGKLTSHHCFWEDYEGGQMSFSTDHFSKFIIAKNVPSNQVTNAEEGESTVLSYVIPAIIAAVLIVIVSVVGIVIIVVMVNVKKKRKG